MKTLEKHLLILDPLLEELAPLGYFRKGRQLWHINRQEGYAILIEVEMYMRGVYKRITVQYGSFWQDVKASQSRGVWLGDLLSIDEDCVPFDTVLFDTPEALDKIVRESAPLFVNEMRAKVLPILRTIHDMLSFVRASEALDALTPSLTWPRRERALDYLALGDQQGALDHLDRLMRYSWQDRYEANLAALPTEEQERIRSQSANSSARADQVEEKTRRKLQAYRDELVQMDSAALTALLRERRVQFEAILAAYIGPRRWNQI